MLGTLILLESPSQTHQYRHLDLSLLFILLPISKWFQISHSPVLVGTDVKEAQVGYLWLLNMHSLFLFVRHFIILGPFMLNNREDKIDLCRMPANNALGLDDQLSKNITEPP